MGGEKKNIKSPWIRIAEKLADLLLVALLVVLIGQCALYMWQYTHLRRSSSDVPFDMRALSSSSGEAFPELEPSLLQPESMGIRDGEHCYGIFHTSAVMEELYRAMAPCLYTALGSEEQLADSEAWQSALTGKYVYAEFSGELPYQAVYAFAAAYRGEDPVLRRAERYIGVRELLLVLDRDGTPETLLVRGTGGVFRFRCGGGMAGAEFLSFPEVYADSFCIATLRDCGSYSVLETDASFSARAIFASGGVTSLLTVNQDFLRVLDFNPDKLSYHEEQDGSYVYVESHGTLHTGSDEVIYRASDSGGIDLSALNGGETGDIYAYLRAASYLISWLENVNGQYVGGDARLRLDRIYSDGKHITLHFGYRCDGIAIRHTDREYGLTVQFSGERVTEIRYRMMIVRRSLEERRVMLQDWYRRILSREGTDMRLLYTTDGSMDMIMASWAVIVPEKTTEGAAQTWDGQS